MPTALATNVPRSRTINTTSPIQGGGTLGADRTLSLVDEAVELIYGSLPAYSVKREGGDPTGATDSSAAVNSAIAKAKAAGGGIVVFGPGTWQFKNAPLESGVQFRGCGTSHAYGGTTATRLRLPASVSPGDVMFRLSGSASPEYIDGGGIFDCEIDGRRYSDAASMPAAPTTTVETDKIRGLDFRQGPRVAVGGVDTGTDTFTTASAHGFANGDAVAFDIASGGTLPTGVNAQPSMYYAGQVTATTLVCYDTRANALAGGATGKINLTLAGSGTFYVFRSVLGVTHFAIERCYLHNFDEAVRGSCLIDRSMAFYTHFRYCYVAFQGQEHPKFLDCDFRFCYFGITGRYVDFVLDGSNKFASNYYAVCPYDPVGAGGSSYLGNFGATYFCNNCVLSGLYFGNVVAITATSNCVIPPHTYIDGGLTDAGDLQLSRSIGVRLQGTNNRVSGYYGQGTASTTFAIAAILLDNASGTAGVGHVIDGATFNLVSGVAGNCAIGGGNTKLTTPLFATGSYGAIGRFTVQNCTAKLANMRFMYIAPLNGSSSYTTIRSNSIELVSGGTATMGSGAGIIECNLYTGSDVAGNRVYNVSGTCGSAIENYSLAFTSVRFLDNQFAGTWSIGTGKPVDFSAGAAVTCTFRNNNGFTTEASGSVTFGSGSATAVVTHGLALTPPIANISVTPQADTTPNAGWWISDVTATQFTINLDYASTNQPTFSWQARISAA